VPAYVIFPDRTLIEMAERRPQRWTKAMAGITGRRRDEAGALRRDQAASWR
jgi:superfamily II DNA helicase RecQ